MKDATPTPTAHGIPAPDTGTPVVLTGPMSWIALIALGLAVLAALTWSIVGTVPRTLPLEAVVSVRSLERVISTEQDGIVTKISHPGTAVLAGEVVASVAPYGGGAPIELVAPVTGVVYSQRVAAGAGVSRGEALLSITAELPGNGPIDVVAYAPPTEVSALHAGDPVQVFLPPSPSSTGVEVTGVVASVATAPSPLIDVAADTGADDVARALATSAGNEPYRVVVKVTVGPEERSALRAGQLLSMLVIESSVHPLSLLLGG